MINGVINLYKESGWTSNDAVAKLRGILKQKKIGHGGTLDPDAEGVLPICLGKATRLFDYIGGEKTYCAEIIFGITTDTQDTSGKVLKERAPDFTLDELEKVLCEFRGEISQIPPMYSALKKDGKKLYELARSGQTIEREARKVYIRLLERVSPLKDNRCSLLVTCSKGAYIRTLCNDIGEKLSCGGAMAHLVRLEAAGMKKENALTIAQVEQLVKNGDFSFVTPIDEVLCFMPKAEFSEKAIKKLENGNPVEASFTDCTHEGFVRMYCGGKFFGIGQKSDDKFFIKCMLAEEE